MKFGHDPKRLLKEQLKHDRQMRATTPTAPVPEGCSCTSYPHTCHLEARYYDQQATSPVQDDDAALENTEVVANRLSDTPDWVWSPPDTAYHDTYLELLLDTPNGMRRAVGIYRKGPFWGKEVDGWFAPEQISENGRPSHSMYVDGFVKGWRPYRYHRISPTPDTGLIEALRAIASQAICYGMHADESELAIIYLT